MSVVHKGNTLQKWQNCDETVDMPETLLINSTDKRAKYKMDYYTLDVFY